MALEVIRIRMALRGNLPGLKNNALVHWFSNNALPQIISSVSYAENIFSYKAIIANA